MSKSNQFESPCYFLSAEEYTQDYLSLPELQLACLFKLRSAYALKGSPLSEDDIEGLYPVYTPVHEKTLGKVLNKFFTKKGDVFVDIRIESQIEKRKEHQLNIEQLIEKEVQKRVARALAGMKGGLSKARNRKNQNISVSEEEFLTDEVPEEQQAICEEPEDFKQTSSKTVANGWQNPSKVVANAKQTSDKVLANSKKRSSKPHQPVDFVENSESFQNTPDIEPEDDPSLACAHVCASDNPISDVFLINKKNKNKSESVSESVKEKTENFKNQKSREKFSAGKIWTLNALLSDVLPRFDQEAFDLLIARCKEQKRSEGANFAGSIAYVISSLEREKVTVKRRKKKSERDYTEGLIQNPDGSWRPDPNYVPKKKKYSDRDWTEGLIKNPDGSYSLDPNYER